MGSRYVWSIGFGRFVLGRGGRARFRLVYGAFDLLVRLLSVVFIKLLRSLE